MKSDSDNSGSGELAHIRQQAADWIVKRDAGFTAEEQDRFFEWLSADPRHAEVYARLQAVFKRMDVMVEWRPLHALEPNPDLLASAPARSGRWRTFAALGGLAAMIAVAFIFWPASPTAPVTLPVRLVAGEAARSFEDHVLADGSVVTLNRGAQVAVSFEPARRVLDLISGEAYFKVAKDPARPFIVRAGGVAVNAVGTEFNVALAANQLEVLVTKGRVRVDPPASAPAAGGAAAGSPVEALLEAGQGVVLATDAPVADWIVSAYTSQVMEQKLAWRSDLVSFRATPLSEVALEFNRRNHTQLVIGDEALAQRAITGSLRLTNLEGFLEILSVTHGIRAERHGTSKIVLRSAP